MTTILPENPDKATANPVVTLCGSLAFFRQMLQAAADLTLAGNIVLMPHCAVKHGTPIQVQLAELHRAKILMADKVIVITNQDGYTGPATMRDIIYATDNGIPVETMPYEVYLDTSGR